MRRLISCAVLGAFLIVGVACGGGDDPSGSATPSNNPATTGPGGIATLSGLQGQLAAVPLQQNEVPDGLDAAAPDFSTNEDIAGANQEALQTLIQQGRQLGLDVQFIPTQRLDPNTPLRGGIGSSASVYTNTVGASESFQQTAAAARANNWAANYPDFIDLHVIEVQQTIGDESVWLRIIGKDCLPSAASGSTTQACNGPQHVLYIDNVVFRVGRVRAYLQVPTMFDASVATPESYQDQVSQWAAAVVQHAKATFPTS